MDQIQKENAIARALRARRFAQPTTTRTTPSTSNTASTSAGSITSSQRLYPPTGADLTAGPRALNRHGKGLYEPPGLAQLHTLVTQNRSVIWGQTSKFKVQIH